MENITERLAELCEKENIDITAEQLEKFQCYYETLLEWNAKINLTSITESGKIIEKHFLDSILILKHVPIPVNASLVDVGSGAGFPGIPLKIMRPDIELTLLDSLNKRIVFLDALCEALQIEADTVHLRAEQAGQDLVYRESFNIAVARAVAGMNLLAEYCLPLVKKNGFFIAMKGPNLEDELENAKTAIAAMGGKTDRVEKFALPCGDERSLVKIDKLHHTFKQYPRHGGMIAKKPL